MRQTLMKTDKSEQVKTCSFLYAGYGKYYSYIPNISHFREKPQKNILQFREKTGYTFCDFRDTILSDNEICLKVFMEVD